MITVPIPDVSWGYEFHQLDYIAVEPYDSYLEDEDETVQKFAVVAWGLDADGCLPWEEPQFRGRFVEYFDTKQEAIELAEKYAQMLGVSYKVEV